MKYLLLLILPILFCSCAKNYDGTMASPFVTDGEVYAFGFWPKPKCPACPKCPEDKEPPLDQDPILKELLKIMNEYRARVGAPALSFTDGLNCAAEKHSLDLGKNKMCSHVGSDGSSPWDRAKDCGTNAYGEIVACGQRTPAQTVEAWYNSEGHKNIMLDSKYTKVGMGMSNYYWTAVFR